MEYEKFFDAIKHALPPGTVLKNPGKGSSTIEPYTDTQMVYKRGDSTIYVEMRAFHDAYMKFSGKRVTSNDLKIYNPEVFDVDSNGHSCNCTMLFMTLRALRIALTIKGTGKRGDHFWITIPADGTDER
jgi:hypothetical protein